MLHASPIFWLVLRIALRALLSFLLGHCPVGFRSGVDTHECGLAGLSLTGSHHALRFPRDTAIRLWTLSIRQRRGVPRWRGEPGVAFRGCFRFTKAKHCPLTKPRGYLSMAVGDVLEFGTSWGCCDLTKVPALPSHEPRGYCHGARNVPPQPVPH